MLLLAVPMLALLVPGLQSFGRTNDEDRELAAWPGLPESGKAWSDFPRQADDYLQDHFGFRRILVFANSLIHARLGNGNDLVFVGYHDHLFYRAAETLKQSAGATGTHRWPWIASTVNMLAEMQRVLAEQGTKLFVTSPPSSSTMEQPDLPAWAQTQGRTTEYDHFLNLLDARGIPALDLRPVLAAAAKTGKTYFRHDTHWTPYGAVVAYNAVVAADGHPGWRVPLSVVKPASGLRVGGDLGRLLGINSLLLESYQYIDLPPPARQQVLQGGSFPAFVDTTLHPGPTIMVIGDSFTDSWFIEPLLLHAGRVVFSHAALCGFNWAWITRYHPAEVWYAPTERLLPCKPGTRPVGMPAGVPRLQIARP